MTQCTNTKTKDFFLIIFFLFCLHYTVCENLSSQTRLNPYPLYWKHEVLTTGQPGKSQNKKS